MSKKTIRSVQVSDVGEGDLITLSDHKAVCFKVIGRDEKGLVIDTEPFRVELSDVSKATGFRTMAPRVVGRRYRNKGES